MRKHIFTTITIDLCRGGIFYEHIYSKSKVIKGNKKSKREENSYAEAEDILFLTDSLVVVLKYDYEDKKVLIR